jgi:hypothetical protein
VAISINGVQRDALHGLLRTRLSGIESIYLFTENEDHDRAQQVRAEHTENMRLLDDLGWADEDLRERFELTLEPATLIRILERLRLAAAEGARSHVGTLAAEALEIPQMGGEEPDLAAEYERSDAVAYKTCEGLLAQLRGQHGHPIRHQPPAAGDGSEVLVGVGLTLPQREAIWPDVVCELGRIDIAAALEQGNAGQAAQLHQHYQEALQLLGDIGWERDESLGWFEITLPRTALRRLVGRLRELPLDALRDYGIDPELLTDSPTELDNRPEGPRRAIAALLTYDLLLAITDQDEPSAEAPASDDSPDEHDC